MAEPTTALSMYDLVTKVAEFAGMAYYGTTANREAGAPTDLYDLDTCERIVQNAIRMFISNAPPRGWNWQKRIMSLKLAASSSGTASSGSATTLVDSDLAATYANDYYNNCILEITGGTGIGEWALVTDYTGASGTFTFSALSGGTTPDATSEFVVGHRYKLADDFGGTPDGPIQYMRGTGRGTPVQWVDEARIRALRENSEESGTIELAAIRSFGVRQHELIVYPDPTEVLVVQFPYTTYSDKVQLVTGIAESGNGTTLVDTAHRLEVDDTFNTWILTVRNGTGLGETATITDFVQSTGTLTFAALSGGSTPDTTTVYSIEPASNNTHPAGHQFDQIILSACLARAEMEIEDLAAGWMNVYSTIDLSYAYQLDARNSPRRLGYCGNGPRHSLERTWGDRTVYDADGNLLT